MPIDYKNYDPAWKSVIRPAVLDRAENRCETCGVENKKYIYRSVCLNFWYDPEGDQYREYPTGQIYEGIKSGVRAEVVKIVLTIAHLNHDVKDNSRKNLKALCQLCHLRYDAEHHKANAAKTRQSRKAIAGLFEEGENDTTTT